MNKRARRRQAKLESASPSAPARGTAASLFEAALSHRSAGRLGDTEAHCLRILDVTPLHTGALDLLGIVCALTDRLPIAAQFIAHAVALNPGDPGFHNNLGNVLTSLGRLDEAIASFGRSLALRADDAETQCNLGTVLRQAGRTDEAKRAYERALAINSGSAEAHSNYGNLLADLGRYADAASSHERALSITPDYAVAHNNLGYAWKRLGRYKDAAASFERAVALQPGYADALNNLAETRKEQGDAPGALAHYHRALALEPGRAGVRSNMLLALNGIAEVDAETLFAEHRRWDAIHGRAMPAPPPGPARRDGRIRIGYVSSDFRRHSVAYFIEPILEAHDRTRFFVVCYSGVRAEDDVTRRLRADADLWRPIAGLGDTEVIERVRADGVDILVDLAGHTMGNRLGVFAGRAAPVQITYLGYPNTTGLAAMDWRITDSIADARGADAFYTERLVRLDRGFLCYRPPPDAPAPAPPSDPDRPVTFVSCNSLAKVGPQTIETWSRILNALPDSRLLLKAKALGCAGTCERLAEKFVGEGVARDRLEITGWTEPGAHLAIYGGGDVALDTWPYNGTTTTFEALWMGIPVVTLADERHAGRVGASILARIGLRELVADSTDKYVETALALARDRGRRAALRTELRPMMVAAGLTDARAFTEGLEAAMLGIWQERTKRIAVDGNHHSVAIERVNPLETHNIHQVHVVGGSPAAIPTDHDLV
jgi:predicted O-linked N-acetylglucosamine transferase (SPINDLY family)